MRKYTVDLSRLSYFEVLYEDNVIMKIKDVYQIHSFERFFFSNDKVIFSIRKTNIFFSKTVSILESKLDNNICILVENSKIVFICDGNTFGLSYRHLKKNNNLFIEGDLVANIYVPNFLKRVKGFEIEITFLISEKKYDILCIIYYMVGLRSFEAIY